MTDQGKVKSRRQAIPTRPLVALRPALPTRLIDLKISADFGASVKIKFIHEREPGGVINTENREIFFQRPCACQCPSNPPPRKPSRMLTSVPSFCSILAINFCNDL